MTQAIRFGELTALCDDPIEVWRAETFLTKEPGTIDWLNGLHEGDVFYDVGANIGLYSLYAATRVGPTGHVYAFEPHLVNAAHLVRNVLHNHLQDRITVLAMALDEWAGVSSFHYASVRAGASGSQLDEPIGEDGQRFTPVLTELKSRCSVVSLSGHVRAADAVKIDVDGRELSIVKGMAFGAHTAPRTLQVEQHANHRVELQGYLVDVGYRCDGTHFTANGVKAIRRGVDPATVTSNAVFVRAA